MIIIDDFIKDKQLIDKMKDKENSILLIRPAPVKFAKNLDNLECDKFAFVRRDVVFVKRR